MEKLLELLNEYSKWNWKSFELGMFVPEVGQENILPLHYNSVLGKEFGFIKWLVENNKIDPYYYENSVRVKRYIDEYDEYDYVFPMDYEQLIMLLSIQDNPIEFLIGALK